MDSKFKWLYRLIVWSDRWDCAFRDNDGMSAPGDIDEVKFLNKYYTGVNDE